LLTVACLVIFNVSLVRAEGDTSAWLTQEWAGPALGKPVPLTVLEGLPKHVFADGSGLPEGSGKARDGAEIYAQQCASCHGPTGQGGRAMELVGDRSLLDTEYPDKGIGVYWPYAPTLFEYVYRSMPPDKPASLNDDQLYALLAHLLVLNGLLDAGTTLDAAMLSSIDMPNRYGFRMEH
jgi:cytochrome c